MTVKRKEINDTRHRSLPRVWGESVQDFYVMKKEKAETNDGINQITKAIQWLSTWNQTWKRGISRICGRIARESFGGKDSGRRACGTLHRCGDGNGNLIVVLKNTEFLTLLFQLLLLLLFLFIAINMFFAGISDYSICSRGYHVVSHDKANRSVQTTGWFRPRSVRALFRSSCLHYLHLLLNLFFGLLFCHL